MKKLLNIIILISLLIKTGCNMDYNIATTKELKSLGYEKFNCDSITYNELTKEYEVYSYVIPKNKKLSMLVARCLEEECVYEMIPDYGVPSSFICQIFHNNENNTSVYDREQIIMTFNIEKFNDIKE